MKKFVLLFLFFLMLVSCSKSDSDDKEIIYDYYGKWKNIIPENVPNTTSLFKEYYEFGRDNIFTKTRITDNSTITATGTFTVTNTSTGVSLTLTYKDDSYLIINCSHSLTENLTLNNTKYRVGYLDNDARMCDAESTYEKIK